ncbi:MAG: hypothetical protein WDZ91_09600 [Paenibacillaceae bacterium]
MHNWIKDALLKKFDDRIVQSEQNNEFEKIREQLLEMEKRIYNNLSDDSQQLINDWLDLNVRMTTVQNEWLYTKGIQDGIYLIVYLQLEKEYIS